MAMVKTNAQTSENDLFPELTGVGGAGDEAGDMENEMESRMGPYRRRRNDGSGRRRVKWF